MAALGAAEDGLFYGLERGRVAVVQGGPGTGKSHVLGSVCAVVPPERTLLLATNVLEANSHSYRLHGLSRRAEIFHDPDWDPDLGQTKAEAFMALRKRLRALRGDPAYDAILIDSGTDAIRLLENRILASLGMASIGDLRGRGSKDASYSFYDQLGDRAASFMGALAELTLPPAPKFVIVSWHSRAASESDDASKGIDHEGKVLPMMRGQYRKKLAGDADMVLFTDIQRKVVGGKQVASYVMRVLPSTDEHSKVRSISMEGAPEFIPNEFAEYLKLEHLAMKEAR